MTSQRAARDELSLPDILQPSTAFIRRPAMVSAAITAAMRPTSVQNRNDRPALAAGF